MLYPAELRARVGPSISAPASIGQLLTLLVWLAAAPLVADENLDASITVAPTTGRIEITLADGELVAPAALAFPWSTGRAGDEVFEAAERAFISYLGGGSLQLAPGYQRDRYDRSVGRLFNDQGAALDEFAVQSGLALVDPAIGDLSPEVINGLLELESQAREARSGLWRQGDLAIDATSPPDRLVDRFAIVKGRVLKATVAKQYLYLNFGDDWRTDFSVRVTKKLNRRIKRQGHDLAALAGRAVAVRGWVFEENGPMIELLRVEQIEIIP